MRLEHPSATDPDYAWFHCPGCNSKHAVRTGSGPGAWTWNGDADRPTLSPSVLATITFPPDYEREPDDPPERCHSFVTDGRIQFLDDCSHALRGWHDLPEIPCSPS